MTKISGFPEDTSPTTDDFLLGVDSGTSTTKKVKWLNVISMIFGNAPTGSLNRAAVDWSSFSNNIKSAGTTTGVNPAENTNTNLGPYGAVVNFTLSGSGIALVIVSVGAGCANDFESKPQIWVDGSLYVSAAFSAAAGNTAGRAVVRTFSYPVALSTGSHTICAGWLGQNGAPYAINPGSAQVTAMVLGNVTA